MVSLPLATEQSLALTPGRGRVFGIGSDMAPIIRCLTVWRHGETRRHNRTSEPPPPPPEHEGQDPNSSVVDLALL